ncbi:MAG: hypothetical protein HYZ00_10775 [Candidatus Hydrogenedentes bacterium]|nr:hypothetical protein [Candidatus Hydrogenedentota bacterium]
MSTRIAHKAFLLGAVLLAPLSTWAAESAVIHATVSLRTGAELFPGELVYHEDFEHGLNGFTIDNNFSFGRGLWRLTDQCAAADPGHSSSNALFYGQESTCNYKAGRTEGVVYSPVISLRGITPPIELSFKYLLETEGHAPQADSVIIALSPDNRAYVKIAENNPATIVTPLADPSGGWREAKVNLSAFAGSDIRLRIRFQTLNALNNQFPGMYLDDFRVTSGVIYRQDFESGLGDFSVQSLVNGLWHWTTACAAGGEDHTRPAALYYGLDSTCDYNAGSSDGMVTSPIINLQGMAPPIYLHFKYFLETEGTPDTADKVAVALSQNGKAYVKVAENLPTTTVTRLEDPSGGWRQATLDLSAMAGSTVQVRFRFRTVDPLDNDFGGFYLDDFLVTAGIAYREDFEEDLGGFTITNVLSSGTVLWHQSESCAGLQPLHSAPATLYYGQDATCDYDAGRSDGLAETPPLDLTQMTAPIVMSFRYFLETQGQPLQCDKVTVAAAPIGKAYVLLADNLPASAVVSLADPSQYWRRAVVDLSRFAGNTVRVRFRLRTMDATDNAHPGWYVDDLVLRGRMAAPKLLLEHTPGTAQYGDLPGFLEEFSAVDEVSAGPGASPPDEDDLPPAPVNFPGVTQVASPTGEEAPTNAPFADDIAAARQLVPPLERDSLPVGCTCLPEGGLRWQDLLEQIFLLGFALLAAVAWRKTGG